MSIPPNQCRYRPRRPSSAHHPIQSTTELSFIVATSITLIDQRTDNCCKGNGTQKGEHSSSCRLHKGQSQRNRSPTNVKTIGDTLDDNIQGVIKYDVLRCKYEKNGMVKVDETKQD